MPPLKESTRLLIKLKTNAVKMSPADCERFMRVVELLEFWEKREKSWNKEFRAKEREERKKEEERQLLLQELLQEEKEKGKRTVASPAKQREGTTKKASSR